MVEPFCRARAELVGNHCPDLLGRNRDTQLRPRLLGQAVPDAAVRTPLVDHGRHHRDGSSGARALHRCAGDSLYRSVRWSPGGCSADLGPPDIWVSGAIECEIARSTREKNLPLHPTHGAYAKVREAPECPSHCLLSVLRGNRVALRMPAASCKMRAYEHSKPRLRVRSAGVPCVVGA